MITKSNYVKYTQCPNSLWLKMYKPELAAELSDFAVGTIEDGNRVGDLAMQYFPGTVSVECVDENGIPQLAKQLELTQRALADGADCIAEASVTFRDLYCAVDLLKRDGEGYSIYEVKSSLGVSDKQKKDVSFQKYVLEHAGFTIQHIYILHPNRDYIYDGTLDISSYFVADCMDTDAVVLENLRVLEDNLNGIHTLLDQKEEPNTIFQNHCKECEFRAHCLRDIPEDAAGSLPNMRGVAELYNAGIITISDYISTEKYKKSKKNQRREAQIEAVLTHRTEPVIDQRNLKSFIDSLQYPIYHLDFETSSDIIPEVVGLHPDESYPFQYSLHIEYADGAIVHKEFLGESKDCTRELAEALCRDIPMDSQLLAYHASTESGVCKYLAGKYPDLSEHLLNLSTHFTDLLVPFSKGYYYHPLQGGSDSIKHVMPALCPHMANAYHELPVVHNGTEALSMFGKMVEMKGTSEYDRVRDGMLKYCELDTLSMVEVLKVLKKAVK